MQVTKTDEHVHISFSNLLPCKAHTGDISYKTFSNLCIEFKFDRTLYRRTRF